jgi:hypothetical protein
MLQHTGLNQPPYSLLPFVEDPELVAGTGEDLPASCLVG